MPLQKILFKPGVNRENTRYTTEGGWYECDKVRFRQGNPESIGGWQPFSGNTFLGICRSMWNWITLAGLNLIGLGTNLKFYIQLGGAYNDITPIRETTTINTNPFALTASPVVTVTDTAHGCGTGDFVTFSGAVDIGGVGTNVTAAVLNQEFQVTVLTVDTYTITLPVTPNATAIAGSPGGGGAVVAAYQISVGSSFVTPAVGWGAGAWGSGSWGVTASTLAQTVRLWSQQNYGQNLVFGPRGGGVYYWDATTGLGTRGKLLNTLGGNVTFTVASPTVVTLSNPLSEGTAVQFAVSSGGTLPTGISAATTYTLFDVDEAGITANLLDPNGALVNVVGAGSGTFYISLLVDVPVVQNFLLVSDTSRFVFALGSNEYGEQAVDPMLIRWSDKNNLLAWTPDTLNQAGSLRLSHGSEIITSLQTRQEIVVFTDTSIYSLQYLGPPLAWGSQLLGDNVSIAGPSAAVLASGVVYWMGVDKFYVYDGRVQTLDCDLRRFVFNNFNQAQRAQVYAGTNEAFNEVWWLYCSADAIYNDRYVIFNYLERVWYYGTIERSAWLDSGLQTYPLAALYNPNTQISRLISHENGLNDNTDGTNLPLNAYISSSEFDIGDGHNFGFVWRVVPDLTFANSTTAPTGDAPQVAMTLYGLYNSGSGSIDNASGAVLKGTTYVVPDLESFTGQIYTRVRGRQLIFKIASNQVNTAWQIGAPRIDIRPDGRR